MSQQINLFNPIYRKQKKYFSSVTMVQALGIIVLASALLAADSARRTRQAESQLAASVSQLKQTQDKLTVVKAQFPPRQKSPTLQAEIVLAQQELLMLSSATDVVKRGGFGDTRGYSPYFRAFARQALDGLWLTHVDIASGGSQLGVRGHALQADLVPQYMQRLAKEPVMQGQSFSSLEINRGEEGPEPGAAATGHLKFSLQSAGVRTKVAVVSK